MNVQVGLPLIYQAFLHIAHTGSSNLVPQGRELHSANTQCFCLVWLSNSCHMAFQKFLSGAFMACLRFNILGSLDGAKAASSGCTPGHHHPVSLTPWPAPGLNLWILVYTYLGIWCNLIHKELHWNCLQLVPAWEPLGCLELVLHVSLWPIQRVEVVWVWHQVHLDIP